MHISIEPLTQFNSFVKEPNGLYHVSTCVDHNGYYPYRENFEESKIDEVTEKMRELLQFFKGEHAIRVSKLIRVKPFTVNRMGRDESRDWKIVFGKSDTFLVDNPKIAKVVAYNGSSLSGRGWFLKAEFGIEGIRDFDFGTICSSYKSAKEHFEHRKKYEEISHWMLEERRKARTVKCNGCGKKIQNLTAEQCSDCGRYWCPDCMGSNSECPDCQMKED